MIAVYVAIAAMVIPRSLVSQQTSDADLDAEGQVAMNQFHDCARAKNAFERESASAQGSPIWLDEVARASECSADLPSALKYYELELKKLPDTPRLVQKVGELRYRQTLQAEQRQAQQAAAEAAAEQQHQQAIQVAEQQRQQAIRDEQDRAAARGKIDQSMQELAQLLEGDFKVDFDYPDNGSTVRHHIVRHVTRISHCELSITEHDSKSRKGPLNENIDFATTTAEFWDNKNLQLIQGTFVVLSTSFDVLAVTTNPGEVVRLVNELHRACSP